MVIYIYETLMPPFDISIRNYYNIININNIDIRTEECPSKVTLLILIQITRLLKSVITHFYEVSPHYSLLICLINYQLTSSSKYL